jgi:DNA-binding NtrC family response regulator
MSGGAVAGVLRKSDRSALVLVSDEDLRETIATIIGELSGFAVTSAADLAEARTSIAHATPSIVIVAPRWLDRDFAALLEDLPGTDPAVVVIAVSEGAAHHPNAIVVQAPFDVETLLAAIESALANVRSSRTRIPL